MKLKTPHADLLPPLTTEEYTALAADIAINGVLSPIVVDEDNNILDGHNRYSIDSDAPTVIISGLSEAEKIAYVYRSNNIRRNMSPAQKKAQREKMKAVALDLKNEGKTQEEIGALLGVNRATVSKWLGGRIVPGHNVSLLDVRIVIPEELDEVILDRVESGEDKKQIAADFSVVPRTISRHAAKAKKKRDAPMLKPNPEPTTGKRATIINGRAEKTGLPDATVDLIITSPPYNLGMQSWPMGGNGRRPWSNGIEYDSLNDEMTPDQYVRWQMDVFIEMWRVSKDGASFFYNHKPRNQDGHLIHPMDWIRHKENPWTLRQEIIWDRTSTHNHSPTLFWPEDERIYWMTKGKPEIPERPIGMSTVWRFHGPTPNTWHPAPFSEELPKRCIEAIGRDGITVLDPFAGSFTTIKVALDYGYDAIGIDISEEYTTRGQELYG